METNSNKEWVWPKTGLENARIAFATGPAGLKKLEDLTKSRYFTFTEEDIKKMIRQALRQTFEKLPTIEYIYNK